MHDLTNDLLKAGAVLIAFGGLLLVNWFDHNLLHLTSLSDVAQFYGIYFVIVIVGSIPLGIFLGLFDYLLDELFGY